MTEILDGAAILKFLKEKRDEYLRQRGPAGDGSYTKNREGRELAKIIEEIESGVLAEDAQ